MRILQVHNFYQQPGGEDAVLDDEKSLLESRGHEVVRYTRHNDEIKQLSSPSVVRQTFWSKRSFDELRTIIRDRRPDVVHRANLLHLVSPSAYYAARVEGVPVVQTLHNFRIMCPNSLFARNEEACEKCLGKTFAWPAIQHACYRESRLASTILASMIAFHRLKGTWTETIDWYIALSEFSRTRFEAGGLDPARISVKPNFVLSPPPPGDGAGGYAIFVGRLAPEKGITTLLKAWRQLGSAMALRIVGDGPLGEAVGKAAQRDRRIQWMGRRPKNEVYDLVGAASCLVLPSHCYENCPKTLLEAYAMGTPVVASRIGALKGMVQDGETGWLFEPGDADDLAAAVERLPQSAQRWMSFRRAARDEFERRYAPDTNYEMLMAVYEQAIGVHGRSAAERTPATVSC